MTRRARSLWLGASLASGLLGSGCATTQPRPTPAAPPGPVVAADPQAVVQAQATEAAADGDAPNIDLAGALELAGAANPTVNLAREASREAEAVMLAADALKWPSLNAGFNFAVHRGTLQRSGGAILAVDRQSLYFGGGARALGAQTVAVPGVRLFYPLADVIAEPRVARLQLVGRRADAVAVQNLTLLDVAAAYLELVRADAALDALRRGEAELAEVVRVTAAFARTGQGRDADAKRAAANAALLLRQVEEAVGERTVASARLAELVGLDPTLRLTPTPGPLVALRLIDAGQPLEALIARAEANRPELVARSSEAAAARVRVRQEEARPWLPTISAGYSVGGFGGGSDPTTPGLGHFGTRTDFDVAAVWTVQNLGYGNRALVRRTGAAAAQAAARRDDALNRVREDVTEARAQIAAAVSRIETARRQLAAAEDGFREEARRVQQGEGVPLEALDSTRSLLEARLDLVRALTDHNLAQFRLLAAVGAAPAP